MAKVFIAEDAVFMRNLIRDILEEDGHEVIGEADNGASAVEQYLLLKPDLVTMDITMPVMNGIDAVKAIISKDPAANIIMCSAMGQQNHVLQAIEAGAKDFIVKPFHRERLLKAVANLT